MPTYPEWDRTALEIAWEHVTDINGLLHVGQEVDAEVTGGLLALLRERGRQCMMGVELDEHAVVACVQGGLDVVQADLNTVPPKYVQWTTGGVGTISSTRTPFKAMAVTTPWDAEKGYCVVRVFFGGAH